MLPLVLDLARLVSDGGPVGVASLLKVRAVLLRLMKGQEAKPGQVGCSLSHTMVEQAAMDAGKEILRLGGRKSDV